MKIKVILFFLICSMYAFGQNRGNISTIARVIIPRVVERKSTAQVLDYLKSTDLYFSTLQEMPNLYKIDNIVFGIGDQSYNANPPSLEQLSKLTDEEISNMKKSNITIRKDIMYFNKVQFLIIEQKRFNENIYLFVSEKWNNKALTGGIQFLDADKEHAERIWKNMLKSINFKAAIN